MMMNDFNLLPSEYQSRWQVSWVPVIIITAVALLCACIGAMEWNLHRLQAGQVVIETSQHKNKDIADLKYFSSRAEMLNKEYELLDALITDHTIWSNFLIKLSESIPEGVRLNSLSINARKSVCNVQGIAPNSQVVFVFKQYLEDLSYFDEAAISTIARNPNTEGKEVVYDISCKFSK